MPRKGQAVAVADTKLARARAAKGVTQPQLAAAIGISLATYRRVESGENTTPNLGILANAAICLRVAVEDLIEDSWRSWAVLDERAPAPPDWA